MHISERINVKKILLYFLIMLFAYSISGAIFKIMAEGTLGSIFRHLMPTTPILFLIIMVNLYDIRRFSFYSFIPRIPSNISINLILRRLFWILILTIPLGIFVNKFLSKYGILYTPIIIFSLTALVLSIYYTIRGNLLNATVIFLITLPLLVFLCRDIFYGSRFTTYYSNMSQHPVLMALSGYYLFIMFIFYLISKNQAKVQYTVERKHVINLTYFIVIFSLFSVFMSKEPALSFAHYLMAIVAPVVFFILLLKAMNNTEDIIFLIKIMTFCLFLYCFFGIYFLLLGQSEEVFNVGVHQFATTSEFIAASYLGYSATVGFLLSFLSIKLSNRTILKKLFTISAIFFIVLILLCNVRSAQIGLLSGLCYLLIVSNVSRIKKVYTTILAVVIAVVLYLFLFEKFAPVLYQIRTLEMIKDIVTGNPLKYLMFARLELWKEAIEMIKDYPIFGIGARMWQEYTFLYGERLYSFKDIHGIWHWGSSVDPHNQFLLIAVSYGIPSLISFCLIIFLVLKKTNLLVNKVNVISKNILHGVISILIAWITISQFTRTFFRDSTILPGLVFWFIVAVVVKLGELEEEVLTENA